MTGAIERDIDALRHALIVTDTPGAHQHAIIDAFRSKLVEAAKPAPEAVEPLRAAKNWLIAIHGIATTPTQGHDKHAGMQSIAVACQRALAALSHSAPETAPSVHEFSDPKVQIVYGLLCEDEAPPNPEEHWEGWIARKIVAALFPSAPETAPVEAGALTDARRQAVVDAVNAWQSLRGTNADLDAAIVAALSERKQRGHLGSTVDGGFDDHDEPSGDASV